MSVKIGVKMSFKCLVELWYRIQVSCLSPSPSPSPGQAKSSQANPPRHFNECDKERVSICGVSSVRRPSKSWLRWCRSSNECASSTLYAMI
ncbi:hypothetical protein HZ326_1433 [Fusarium oxysporum f. sp. albedinis]|nr:hypothetical protein HZ326_1433 [Fusarium oxysporum f. sp. albedinis]